MGDRKKALKTAEQYKIGPTPKRPPLVKNNRGKQPQRKVQVGPEDLIDPAIKAWAIQLDDVFERRGPPVGMPMFENNYPCPTTIAANYGSRQFNMSGSMVGILLHLYPTGVWSTADSHYETRTAVLADASTYTIGPNVNNSGSNISIAGTYLVQTAAAPTISNTTTFASVYPLPYESLTSPFAWNGSGVRCSAFGIRVTYNGALSSTKGWVEFVQVAEPPDVAGDLPKQDSSYRRKFFSAQRTHTFYWQPICDDIPFANPDGNVIVSGLTRIALQIGGLSAGDDVLVEYVSVKEYTGSQTAATATPRLQSPDAVHMVNALTMGHGSINHSTNKNGGVQRHAPLHLQAAAHKMQAVPWLKRMVKDGRDVVDTVIDGVKVAKSAAKVISMLF